MRRRRGVGTIFFKKFDSKRQNIVKICYNWNTLREENFAVFMLKTAKIKFPRNLKESLIREIRKILDKYLQLNGKYILLLSQKKVKSKKLKILINIK